MRSREGRGTSMGQRIAQDGGRGALAPKDALGSPRPVLLGMLLSPHWDRLKCHQHTLGKVSSAQWDTLYRAAESCIEGLTISASSLPNAPRSGPAQRANSWRIFSAFLCVPSSATLAFMVLAWGAHASPSVQSHMLLKRTAKSAWCLVTLRSTGSWSETFSA